MKSLTTLLLVCFLYTNIIALRKESINLITSNQWPEENYHGIVHVTNITQADQFYWWFPSRNSRAEDPLLIWFSGGPSCGDEIAIFVENGPFLFDSDSNSIYTNKYSWNTNANLLYIDQPLGTGFSNPDLPYADLPKNQQEVASQMVEFLQKFIEIFPEFKNRAVYLAGESFAGHYLPHFSSELLKPGNVDLQLKGVSYGDSYVNPWVQYDTSADYALELNLINVDKYYELKNSLYHCENMIKRGLFGGIEICMGILIKLISDKDGNLLFNIYDVTKKPNGPLMYNFDPLTKYLNTQPVKASLGMSNRTWAPCSDPGYERIVKDFINNTAPLIGQSIEKGVKILAYNGDRDWVTNYIGGIAWTNSVEWSGQKSFQQAKLLNIDGGLKKSFGNFTFIKVHNAGHMVPMDQPEFAWKMINKFLQE